DYYCTLYMGSGVLF
nr:immunoglobulin light chain junction region [Macaca mulatta]MOW69999.1 immunoglobulin light chain junction region [Macaca mulatta]